MVFKQAGQSKLQGIGSSQTEFQGSKWSSNKQVSSIFRESGSLKPRFKDPNGLQTSRSIQASRNWSYQTRFMDSNGLQTSRSIQASRNQVFSNQDSKIQMVFKQAGESKLQGLGSSQTEFQGSKWSSNKQVNSIFKESGLLKPRSKDANGFQTSRSIQSSRNRVFSN